MSTFRELLADTPIAPEPRLLTEIREQTPHRAVSPVASVHSEQIRALVQQLFLQISSPSSAEADWPIAKRLWMIPRQSWLPDACAQRITDQNLSRLRKLTSEFDFSILWCAPVSWLTASTVKPATAWCWC